MFIVLVILAAIIAVVGTGHASVENAKKAFIARLMVSLFLGCAITIQIIWPNKEEEVSKMMMLFAAFWMAIYGLFAIFWWKRIRKIKARI